MLDHSRVVEHQAGLLELFGRAAHLDKISIDLRKVRVRLQTADDDFSSGLEAPEKIYQGAQWIVEIRYDEVTTDLIEVFIFERQRLVEVQGQIRTLDDIRTAVAESQFLFKLLLNSLMRYPR